MPEEAPLPVVAVGASPVPELLAACRGLRSSLSALQPAVDGGLVPLEVDRVRFWHALVATAIARRASGAGPPSTCVWWCTGRERCWRRTPSPPNGTTGRPDRRTRQRNRLELAGTGSRPPLTSAQRVGRRGRAAGR
ncbi:hypothetical protein [Kineococcus sp. SYSU DK006]|uniref:hypothetical protein n=1 Tax=Kineococcus sp. SYSU DK006 TaxID=3383127 RepID=UPI003D7E46F8